MSTWINPEREIKRDFCKQNSKPFCIIQRHSRTEDQLEYEYKCRIYGPLLVLTMSKAWGFCFPKASAWKLETRKAILFCTMQPNEALEKWLLFFWTAALKRMLPTIKDSRYALGFSLIVSAISLKTKYNYANKRLYNSQSLLLAA